MSRGTADKWSVEAFSEWVNHRLTDIGSPVELIEGYIVPLPVSEQLNRQVERLKQQLQQALQKANYGALEVRSYYPIHINPYSALRPTLTVLSTHSSQSQIHWVIDIDKAEYFNERFQDLRKSLYAQQGIAEYWTLSTEQVELRTNHTPTADEQGKHPAKYQHQQLLHVGERASPIGFSQLNIHIQAPLPLFFLTRTATGSRTHIEIALPLRVDLSLR